MSRRCGFVRGVRGVLGDPTYNFRVIDPMACFSTELADCYGYSNIQRSLKSTLNRAEQIAKLVRERHLNIRKGIPPLD